MTATAQAVAIPAQQGVRATDVALSRAGHRFTLAPANLGELIKFAELMSRSDIAVPKHLRDLPGACFAVASQALAWEMDPFAVANKSYSVNDRMAYEAQMIAAVVNTRSGITGRLTYEFTGADATLKCKVTGVLDGEVLEYTSPAVGKITTKNSPLWKVDPEQQLAYYSARSWARRHVPEVLLGVYSKDEIEDSEPLQPANRNSGVAARLITADSQSTGGFNAALVEQTIAAKPDLAEEGDAAQAETVVEQAKEDPTADPKPDAKMDPEMERAGASAAIDGEPRHEQPEGVPPELIASWHHGYDAVTNGAQ